MDFTVQNTIQPTVPTDLQNKIVSSIDDTATKADNEKEAKKEAYEAAMGQANIFEQAKNKAYANLKYAQYQSQNGGDTSALNSAQSAYNSACNNFADADINVEVLRSSYLDSIFYAGKMGTCAILANSTLA